MKYNRRLDIKVSFNCNNRCKFCVQGEKRLKFNDKTLIEIKRFLKKESKYANEVVFTGGEPTLRLNELIEMVSYACSLGFNTIQIQSNGRLFVYKEFCQKLIQSGANEFSPAIHGHNAKIHDFLTSAPGSFKQTISGIINLKNLGQRVMTNTVITSRNFKFLPDIARLLINLNVDQFQFAFPHILGTADKNKDWLIPTKTQIMPYVKEGLNIGLKAGKTVMTEAIPYCFMQGQEKHIAEKIIPIAKIYESNFVIENYSEYRKNSGKTKGVNCKFCKYNKICEGPWKEYPKLFGWHEFVPDFRR